jgi:hypothetical protein
MEFVCEPLSSILAREGGPPELLAIFMPDAGG